MVHRQLQLTALGARTRRLLRRSPDPVERARALVLVARLVADHAAMVVATTHDGDATESRGAERVLVAALEHLRHVRTASGAPAATGD